MPSKKSSSKKMTRKMHAKKSRRIHRKRSMRPVSRKNYSGEALVHLKKYRTRNSPPYPANEFCGHTKRGNDGEMYESIPNKNGICAWKKVRN